VGLAGVFDDQQVVLFRQFQDGTHGGGLAVEMDGDHRRDRAAGLAVDRAAAFRPGRAVLVKVSGELVGVHVGRALVHIYKVRNRPRLRNGFGGGDEGVGDGDDGVARLDPGSHEREPQSIGAAPDPDAVFGAAEAREIGFKGLDHGPPDEGRRLDGAAENRRELLLQLPVGGYEVQEGNAFGV